MRWRPGDEWAIVEGAAEDVGPAPSKSKVHDYRGQRGQVFYASPQQPSVPSALCGEVTEVGRILSYTPHHMSRPSILPLDVPDRGLTPDALLNTYNANRLAAQGYTGKGTTIVIFAFTGYDQADLDTFATTFGLPKFTPILVGGQPSEPSGEDANGSRSRPRHRAGCAESCRQRPTDRGGRRRLREDRADAGGDGSAVPRRGVELLDRLGLRQADHRRRPGPGAVRPGHRARHTAPRHSTPAETSPAWNAKADRTGRPRPAAPMSGWTRSRRCRR